MENRELENKISSVICGIVPEDSFDKISEKIAAGDVPERGSVKMKNNGNKIKRILFPAAAACIFVVVAVVFGFTYYGNNYAVESVIDIDVNPSIEISINKKDKVLDVVAMNEDGESIIDGMDLRKSDIKVAVNALIGSMVQKGFVVDENSGILVTVQNDDLKKAERIRSEIVTNIDESLGEHNINIPVMNQTLTDSSDAKKFAEENDISVGKAMFIKKLAEKDATLVPEDLAGMSIKDIVKEIKDKNIDIRDIVDYDDDDSLRENVEDAIEDADEEIYDKDDDDDEDDDDGKIDAAEIKVSEEEAKAKAVAAAGVNAEDAIFEEVELERDKNTIVYEIEFNVGDTEYEYTVSAVDGSIVKHSSESEKSAEKNNAKTEENKAPDEKETAAQPGTEPDKNVPSEKEPAAENKPAETPAASDGATPR